MEWFWASLTEGSQSALYMFWETWWALVLGFTIAGAVESFVSEEKMTQVLGGSGLKELRLGTLFGAASSSCSFGAVATTKSLFKKGASPVASLAAFQFASTNLVIELGLVVWILLGWQFVAANFAAGFILIFVLAGMFHYLVPTAWFDEARRHLRQSEGVRDPQCGMEVDPTAPRRHYTRNPLWHGIFLLGTLQKRIRPRVARDELATQVAHPKRVGKRQ